MGNLPTPGLPNILPKLPFMEDVLVDMDTIRKEVDNYFIDYKFTMSDDFATLITNAIDQVDDFRDKDDISDAISNSLILTDDKWTVLRQYCTPAEANLLYAIDRFSDDIFAICYSIDKKNSDKVDEEFEEKETRRHYVED